MTDVKLLREFQREILDKFLPPKQRHFLDYHIANQTPFARDFTELMCRLEKLSPGAGFDVVKRIGGLKGEEPATYEQIVQALCELVIAKKFMDSFPEDQGYALKWEPTDQARTNPEFMVTGSDWRLLVEVKSPSLFEYNAKNRAAATQVPARLPGVKDLMAELSGEEPALPLDNKIKDYLVSAEKKFSSFAETDIPTYGLLFICWGVRMFEAVSPLSSEGCGLLKDTSFYKVDGKPVCFPHVSGVVVTQHQHFIQEMLAERYPFPELTTLDYGEYWTNGSPPNPVFCENKFANRQLPREIKEVLQTVNAGESLDPIANVMDTVFWMAPFGRHT